MALTADQKEQIMQARGESGKESSSSLTKTYRVRVGTKSFPMVSPAGLTYEQALEYCRGIWPDCEIEEMK